MTRRAHRLAWLSSLAFGCLAVDAAAQNPSNAIDLGHGIYQAVGVSGGTDTVAGAAVRVPQSNTFMVVTPGGNVIIDARLAASAAAHRNRLRAIDQGPIKAIVLTHAHGDHTGGVGLWREDGTAIIAQREHTAFMDGQRRLAGFFAKRNAAQFGFAARPPALDVGESYGKLTWSIRGIHEGYAGWFDGNPSTMYGSPKEAYADVVELAGGADTVARRAAQAIDRGDAVRALFLTDIALASDPRHRASLEVRLRARQRLDAASTNSNERGWLAAGIRDAQAKLR